MDELKRDLDRFINKIIIGISLDIVDILVSPVQMGGTPVDTGWARSNWIPSIGTMSTDPSGSKLSVSNTARQSGMSDLLSYTMDKGKIFIANNVPYIGKLNTGGAKIAPAGFVQLAIVRAIKRTAK